MIPLTMPMHIPAPIILPGLSTIFDSCSRSWSRIRSVLLHCFRRLSPSSTVSPVDVLVPSLRILDIIGDSVYWLYANLCDLTRPTARVPGRDRPDARRVCACTAGLYCRLCRTLSARQDVGRQGTPTPGRRRRQRRFAAQGRQAVLPPRLPEDQSAANDARFAIRA